MRYKSIQSPWLWKNLLKFAIFPTSAHYTSRYKQDKIDAGEKFNYVNISLSFLSNLNNGIHIPFSADYIPIYINSFYEATHILIQRKHNFGKAFKIDLILTWLLTNKVETSWACKLICHMMENQRKGISWFPYGDIITKAY